MLGWRRARVVRRRGDRRDRRRRPPGAQRASQRLARTGRRRAGSSRSHAGETVLDGLTREVEEETGLRVHEWEGPIYQVVATAPDHGLADAGRGVPGRSTYEGELHVGDDPDGIVVDAAFVDPDDVPRAAGHDPPVGPRAADGLAAPSRCSVAEAPRYRYEVTGIGLHDAVGGAGAVTGRPDDRRRGRAAVDPPRRHGRVLRVGRAARPPRAARHAGDRRRHRHPAAWSPPRRTRRGRTACTRPCRRVTARRLCPHAVFLDGRHAPLRARSARRVMAIFATGHPAGRAALARRGVPRRHRRACDASGPAAGDRGADPAPGARRGGPHLLGRRRADKVPGQAGVRAGQADGVTDRARCSGRGVFEVAPGRRCSAFLRPLPVAALWGVGPATLAKLAPPRRRRRSVTWPASRSTRVRAALGDAGAARHLHALANGVDDRPVVADLAPKSISHEETFAVDLRTDRALQPELVRHGRLGGVPAAGQPASRGGPWASRSATRRTSGPSPGPDTPGGPDRRRHA